MKHRHQMTVLGKHKLHKLYQHSCWRSCTSDTPKCLRISETTGSVVHDHHLQYKKLSYRRVTAWCVLSVVILPIAMQQCRNYLYDRSWPNWWYEVGDLIGGNVSWTMCTQPWRDQVGCHCLRCHKQTDHGRVVYITCIPTTCCGEIL